MDISADKYESDGDQSNLFLTLLRTVKSLVRRLTGIFTLTEEERLKAGIHLGGEGRE